MAIVILHDCAKVGRALARLHVDDVLIVKGWRITVSLTLDAVWLEGRGHVESFPLGPQLARRLVRRATELSGAP